jgi:hypothetical protein
MGKISVSIDVGRLIMEINFKELHRNKPWDLTFSTVLLKFNIAYMYINK